MQNPQRHLPLFVKDEFDALRECCILAHLRVQVGHIGELADGEEGLANEIDMALDPALFIAACHGHRQRLEADS